MPITALPTPAPSTSDPSTFDARGDALFGALPTMITEANALEASVNAKEVAINAVSTAMASANFKGAWSTLTGAYGIPTSVSHLGRYWMLITASSNITADVPGTSAKWQEIGNVTIQDFQAAVNPKAMSQGVVLTAAASGSSGITVADNANINFGTGNFTLVWKGSLPDWTPDGVRDLLIKYATAKGYEFYIDANNKISVYVHGAGGNILSYLSPTANTFTDGTIHELTGVVIRETAAVAGSFALYIDGFLYASQVINAGSGGDIGNTSLLYVLGTDVVRSAGTCIHTYTLNFALTAAEVLDMYRNGLPERAKWGSQVALYTSNFSAGADTWASATETIAGNIDGIGGVDDVLRFTNSNTTLRTHVMYRNAAQLIFDKRFRVTFNYYIPSANSNIDGIMFAPGTTIGLPGQLLQTVLDTWTTVSFEWTHSNAANFYPYINAFSRGNSSFQDVGGDDVFYIKNMVITEIGATLALEPEGIQPAPGQWLDSSSNLLHAMQPAAGSSLTRRKKDFEVRWTNTWAGSHEAQYIGGVNQAILPVGCYIQSIIGVITGGTINDIIIGDGSDDNRFVTITTGLAAGTVAFAIASPISDGTNYKLVVDPDANFTGSIAWTIKGIILQ